MPGDVAGNWLEDLVELIAGQRRLGATAVGQSEPDAVQPAPVPDVDDLRNRLIGTDRRAGRGFDRLDRGRGTDPDRRTIGDRPAAAQA